MTSCKYPDYLPKHTAVKDSPYGCHLYIKHTTGAEKHGELIGVDKDHVFLLDRETEMVTGIPINSIAKFKGQFARSVDYWQYIGPNLLLTLAHGQYILLTAPLNALVMGVINVSGKGAYSFSNRDFTYEELRMFARYPQGIPRGVKLDEIKRFVAHPDED